MAGVKTGAGGLNILQRDVSDSDTRLGRLSATLAKAKSTGAGIGGLLGGIIGQILIPIPGVGAAIGGFLGSMAGSKIGGGTSGVNQGDILNSKFRKKSAHNITTQIAQQEFSNVAKSTLSSFMQGINPASSLSKFGGGFKTGAGIGTTGIPGLQGGHQLVRGKDMGAFMGGMQGGFGEMFKKAPIAAAKEAALPKIPGIATPGDSTGDATDTAVPGLLGGVTSQPNYSFSPVHQPQGGNNLLMKELFGDMSEEEAAKSRGMWNEEAGKPIDEFYQMIQELGS